MQRSLFHYVGLFDIRARILGYIEEDSESAKLLETMTAKRGIVNCTAAQIVAMFSHVELPEAITDETHIEHSQNYNGSYALVFNESSLSGLWINIGTFGVWELASSVYPWRLVHDLDLVVTVSTIDGCVQLQMDSFS